MSMKDLHTRQDEEIEECWEMIVLAVRNLSENTVFGMRRVTRDLLRQFKAYEATRARHSQEQDIAEIVLQITKGKK